MNLQLLYRCNFRCEICDFWKDEFKNARELTTHEVGIISKKLSRLGPQVVSIGGGEPLLHPDIEKIAATLSRNHFAVMICNGWFMTPEIARALFKAGMYEISISLDYADPARHDAQRGVTGAFDRAVLALEILNSSRARSSQRVHMISVIMNDNIDQVEPLIKLSKKLGITYLVTLYSDNRGRKGNRFPVTDVSARLLELKRKYPEFVALRGYLARFTEAVENGGVKPCYAGKNLLNIDSQGNVTTCIDCLDNPAGNILADDISTIAYRLREQSRTNSCHGCWTSCRGSIESIMYGGDKLGNMFDYYRMTRSVPLVASRQAP